MSPRLLSLSLPLLLTGCTLTRMALPTDFEKSAVTLPVQGRSFNVAQNLSLGTAYTVDDVHRAMSDSGTSNFSGPMQATTNQSWTFKLSQQGQPLYEVQCAVGTNSRVHETLVGELTIPSQGQGSFSAALVPPGGGLSWRLALSLRPTGDALEPSLFQGVLTDGTRRLDVAGTHRIADRDTRLNETTGYTFTLGGALVAAVDLENQGRVLWAASLPDDLRGAVAGAAGALLLYRPLQPALH